MNPLSYRLELLYKKLRLRNLIREFDYSDAEFQLIRSLLKNKNGTAIDVGANYGVYSLFVSEFCEEVIAIEPVPLNFDLLNYQIKRNHARNIQTVNKALSDKPGNRQIHIPRTGGRKNFYRAGFEAGANDQHDTLEVSCTTLDKVSADLIKCNFIKIDVEGHESAVIRGGIETLKRFKPALLVEMNQPPVLSNPQSHTLLSRLEEKGYTCLFAEKPGQYKIWNSSAEPSGVNYFFLTDEQLRVTDLGK